MQKIMIFLMVYNTYALFRYIMKNFFLKIVALLFFGIYIYIIIYSITHASYVLLFVFKGKFSYRRVS